MVHVKICGVTTVSDALACAELGASAIGVNFVSSSPRCVDVGRGREIARALARHVQGRAKVLVVGVVANRDVDDLRELVRDAELGCLQLHGDERPELLAPLLPHAYKALRIATADDVASARRFGGEYILADAKVPHLFGGSGETFDWSLVKELARERKLTLAGGLRPDNVARAIEEVRPWCVDVASGVERAPGIKDLDAVRAFIAGADVRRR